MNIEKIRQALAAAEFEFTTLIPRVTPAYRKSIELCRDMVREAARELPMKEQETRE